MSSCHPLRIATRPLPVVAERKAADQPAEAETNGDAAGTSSPPPPVNKNKRYRKDKPWDTDDIDHWNIPTFTQADNPDLSSKSLLSLPCSPSTVKAI